MNLYLVRIDDADALVMVTRDHLEAAREAAVCAGVRPAKVSVKLLGVAEADVPMGPVIRGSVK